QFAGPDHLYRVTIRQEQPDFRLVVVNQPGGGVVRCGAGDVVPVQLTRLGGWNGEVTLTVEGLPAGVGCVPQVVGPGVQQAALVITAAADAKPWTGEIKVQGSATIQGRAVAHPARAGTGSPGAFRPDR